MADVTIDTILNNEYKICQPKNGFRFSLDSVLLVRFVKKKNINNALDIGAGSGVISLLLHKIHQFQNIDALEYQQSMYYCLNKTIELNQCKNVIKPVREDIKSFRPEKRYDFMISNPPYRKINTGKVCNSTDENIARFDTEMNIYDIFRFSNSFLENSGSLYISYDADLTENLLANCRNFNLEPKRIMFFHPDIDKPAKLVFVEFKKSAKIELRVEPPIFQKINGKNNKNFDKLFTDEEA
ncbi:MAG: tRNA1Val (adenine37-N6)-methyltransferase [Deferribacteres bacterium]|jgi:tRNA1Val (adenine37-N6)-methyltransferase|nr:methyltransferase small [Deferribacteraceae bacterium]MDK2792672.1 tRNA1Val (adenine37-N6)-methyltransferase [Deferribacteres bacterium]